MVLERDFPPDIRVEKEALSLIRQGHQVTVAAYTFKNDNLVENVNGIKVIRKRISRFVHKSSLGALSFPFYFNFWRKFLGIILKNDTYDVIHIHDLPLAQVGYEVKIKHNIPFVLDLHENYPALLEISPYTKKILARFIYSNRSWRKYEQKMVRLADYVICIVEEMKQRIIDFGVNADEVFTIENTPTLTAENLPDISPDKNYITLFYSGGINSHRGLQVVLKGMPEVTGKYSGIRLWIVGEGSYRSTLEKMVEELDLNDFVTFFGWKNREGMTELLIKSDIALIPHLKSEHTDHSFPNKLHEYAEVQKPVVCSDCISLVRMINEMQNGTIYKNDSPEDFAAAVIKLIEGGNLPEQGANGKMWVEKKYNWAVTEKKLFRLYEQLSSK